MIIIILMIMMSSRDAADSDLENIGNEGGNVEVLKIIIIIKNYHLHHQEMWRCSKSSSSSKTVIIIIKKCGGAQKHQHDQKLSSSSSRNVEVLEIVIMINTKIVIILIRFQYMSPFWDLINNWQHIKMIDERYGTKMYHVLKRRTLKLSFAEN